MVFQTYTIAKDITEHSVVFGLLERIKCLFKSFQYSDLKDKHSMPNFKMTRAVKESFRLGAMKLGHHKTLSQLTTPGIDTAGRARSN